MPYSEPDPNAAAYWRKPHDTYSLDDPPEVGTRDRIGWLIYVIGWSSTELARRLNIAPESARQWIAGRRSAPPNLVLWLEDLAAYHLQHKLPVDWSS